MDFRRIDKNTVQCILSEEEMSAYGFRIEDFFSNQEKAREFLEHLVERAEEEIGYEAHSGMVSMQIMKLPDNGIVITLSERDNSVDSFQNMLQNIHQQLASILGPEAAEQLMEDEGEAAMEIAANIENAEDTEKGSKHTDAGNAYAEEESRQRKQNTKMLAAPRVIRFDSLRPLEKLAGALNMPKPVNSSVYFDPDSEHYYLVVKKGRMNLQDYMVLCNALRDYVSAEEYSVQLYAEQFCKEHFEMFIPKHALGILKNIETGMD